MNRSAAQALSELASEFAAVSADALFAGTVIRLRSQDGIEGPQEVVHGVRIRPLLALNLVDPVQNRRAGVDLFQVDFIVLGRMRQREILRIEYPVPQRIFNTSNRVA